jgi:hypothetical protein
VGMTVSDDGISVGTAVGAVEGTAVGAEDGIVVGLSEGMTVGDDGIAVGTTVGAVEGTAVGDDGLAVGIRVGAVVDKGLFDVYRWPELSPAKAVLQLRIAVTNCQLVSCADVLYMVLPPSELTYMPPP